MTKQTKPYLDIARVISYKEKILIAAGKKNRLPTREKVPD